jgi:hypothetical protein
MTEYTTEALIALLSERYEPEDMAEIVGKLNAWLARGDGVAVYENHDLGHPELGRIVCLSFGSTGAVFEGEPPSRMPDLPQLIGWRYQLVGTYRGELLPLKEASA